MIITLNFLIRKSFLLYAKGTGKASSSVGRASARHAEGHRFEPYFAFPFYMEDVV